MLASTRAEAPKLWVTSKVLKISINHSKVRVTDLIDQNGEKESCAKQSQPLYAPIGNLLSVVCD